MKGFICKQLPRAEALFRNTVRLPISVSNITKSSGPQAGRDLVILLRLEGQKVNVSKLNQHTGVSKGEVDIYELTFKQVEGGYKHGDFDLLAVVDSDRRIWIIPFDELPKTSYIYIERYNKKEERKEYGWDQCLVTT